MLGLSWVLLRPGVILPITETIFKLSLFSLTLSKGFFNPIVFIANSVTFYHCKYTAAHLIISQVLNVLINYVRLKYQKEDSLILFVAEHRWIFAHHVVLNHIYSVQTVPRILSR